MNETIDEKYIYKTIGKFGEIEDDDGDLTLILETIKVKEKYEHLSICSKVFETELPKSEITTPEVTKPEVTKPEVVKPEVKGPVFKFEDKSKMFDAGLEPFGYNFKTQGTGICLNSVGKVNLTGYESTDNEGDIDSDCDDYEDYYG